MWTVLALLLFTYSYMVITASSLKKGLFQHNYKKQTLPFKIPSNRLGQGAGFFSVDLESPWYFIKHDMEKSKNLTKIFKWWTPPPSPLLALSTQGGPDINYCLSEPGAELSPRLRKLSNRRFSNNINKNLLLTFSHPLFPENSLRGQRCTGNAIPPLFLICLSWNWPHIILSLYFNG